MGRVPGAQHTRYHERFGSRRKRAAVAAYFVNAYFWGAGRCPGRHSYYGRAGASPGELGCGERKESYDDLRHAWPRGSFLWHQYSSGAISRCPLFPGQISSHLAIAEELEGNVIRLEGHDLVSVPLGFTDTASTTCLHVPSIGLIVAGDAAYNGDHLHLSESPDQQKRQEWIASLDKMESLKPRAVVAGHKRVGNDDSPRIIGETRKYIRDFERLAMQTTTARELYDEMLKLYPDWINRGALWTSVRAIKT
jgi:glyoxylase-like metal-dependent hydrolase (beta-lactamase superfamily II)